VANQHKAFKKARFEPERNLPALGLGTLPNILISLETFNHAGSIFPFFQSLADRGSTDDTVERLEQAKTFFGSEIAGFKITLAPQVTVGGAHNINFNSAVDCPFVLVCSPTAMLDPDALSAVVGLSKMSAQSVAAWELRQAPSESSKLYSPSNLETSWTSARCGSDAVPGEQSASTAGCPGSSTR